MKSFLWRPNSEFCGVLLRGGGGCEKIKTYSYDVSGTPQCFVLRGEGCEGFSEKVVRRTPFFFLFVR